MRRNLIQFLGSLHGGLIVLLLLSIPISIIYPEEPTFFLRGSIILLAVFASDLAVVRLKHLITYLFICALSFVFFFFLLGTTLPEQIYLSAAVILVFLIRIPARIHQDEDILQIPNQFCLILFAIVYILGICIKTKQICSAAYYLAFCYVILLILYTNLVNIESYLSQNKEIANLPGKQILSTNRIMMGGFTILTLLCMILIPASGIDRLFSSLGDFFLWVLRALFSLIPSKEAQEIIETTETAADMGNSQILPYDKETPPWLTALFNIIFFIFTAVVAIGLLAAFIYAIIQLFRRFYHPIQENDDKQEFIESEKREAIIKAVKKEREASPFFHQFRPDGAARKIFRKAIKKGFSSADKHTPKKSPIPESFTPSELEQGAGITDQASGDVLHEVYEKARYSENGCDKSDIERLKASGWK